MAKPKGDPVREDRIRNDAIVDAYGPEEQALGWYSYLENKIRFPFQAECRWTQAVSPILKGERVEVRRLAPEDACTADMLAHIHWRGPQNGRAPVPTDRNRCRRINCRGHR
jgi:hypothetical protein